MIRGFEDSTISFPLWFYDSDEGEYVELVNSSTHPVCNKSFAAWRKLVGGWTDPGSSTTPVMITSEQPGRATLVYRYWNVTGDNRLVEDAASQAVSSVSPPLLPDYDRDGSIDGADVGSWLAGRRFRFWTNEDVWTGDSAFARRDSFLWWDRPANGSDSQVNGRNDLVNLAPFRVDLRSLLDAWGKTDVECVLYTYDPQHVRFAFADVSWAGSRSKFTAVDWFGDDSQIPVPIVGDVSPNYYINVEHAFMTAEALKNACTQLPGEKVMMAHSLGNMLVSAAAKDFNLQYDKYYMLNAAVPMEAYDATAQSDLMVDGAWKDLATRFRASRWSEQFESTPYEGDFRKRLSWKGRFTGITNAINCYSPTEDILENPAVLKVFGMTVGETTGGIWSKQELFKGCTVWYGINSVTFAGTRIEGGWGVNADYGANFFAYVPLVGFNASYFANYTQEDLIARPLFTAFNDSRMTSTNALNFTDYALQAKMLGDAIPAESFAAGRNEIDGVSGNYNYQGEGNMPNGWPSNRDGWFHSDLKDVAFWYTYKLFEKIQKGE